MAEKRKQSFATKEHKDHKRIVKAFVVFCVAENISSLRRLQLKEEIFYHRQDACATLEHNLFSASPRPRVNKNMSLVLFA